MKDPQSREFSRLPELKSGAPRFPVPWLQGAVFGLIAGMLIGATLLA